MPNDALREALRIFVGCAIPVSTQIDPRGHRWSEAYLDRALAIGVEALERAAGAQPSEPVAHVRIYPDGIEGRRQMSFSDAQMLDWLDRDDVDLIFQSWEVTGERAQVAIVHVATGRWLGSGATLREAVALAMGAPQRTDERGAAAPLTTKTPEPNPLTDAAIDEIWRTTWSKYDFTDGDRSYEPLRAFARAIEREIRGEG